MPLRVSRLVSLLLVLAVVVCAGSAAAVRPVVPLFSQHRLAAKTGALAYVPSRVPFGFRYHHWEWHPQARTLQIFFRNKAGQEIVFLAVPFKGDCAAGKEQSFQLDGNKVWWNHSAKEQQAWRCVSNPKLGQVKLVVASTLAPAKFAGSGLGIVAASGKRI